MRLIEAEAFDVPAYVEGGFVSEPTPASEWYNLDTSWQTCPFWAGLSHLTPSFPRRPPGINLLIPHFAHRKILGLNRYHSRC